MSVLTLEHFIDVCNSIPKINKSEVIDRVLISEDTEIKILDSIRELRTHNHFFGDIPVFVTKYLDPKKVYVIFSDGSIKYFDAEEFLELVK